MDYDDEFDEEFYILTNWGCFRTNVPFFNQSYYF